MKKESKNNDHENDLNEVDLNINEYDKYCANNIRKYINDATNYKKQPNNVNDIFITGEQYDK